MKKRILRFSILSLICCFLCNTHIFAYDNPQKATKDAFNNTSLVEQGYTDLNNNVINCRFCYAYDYDGDGRQEGYAISGIWEEGIENGKLWFINSDGTYKLVKEGLYCRDELLEPELVYAGDQIFLVCNQEQDRRVVSLICGCRNGEAYFPAISEKVTNFHAETGHYYAYNITDYSGVEYFYDETTGEFGSDIKTEDIDIDYLTRYYWYYDCGDYKKYQFNKDGTYIEYDSAGNIYAQGQRYSLNNNILTFHHESGDSNWVYVDKRFNDALSHLPDGEKVFFDPDTEYEYISNTHEEVPISRTIKVELNGSEISFDQPPVMINDRVMVPIRAIAEAMGDKVTWCDRLQSALIQHPDRILKLDINKNTINVIRELPMDTWEYVSSDVPPQIIGDRTLVPLRAVAECLGAEVSWDGDAYVVSIEYTDKPKQIITDVDVAKLNAMYSVIFEASNFSSYSDNINEEFERRNPYIDAAAISWNDTWLSVKNLFSGMDNDEYMIKNMLLEIFAELPEVSAVDLSGEIKVANYVKSLASQPGKFIDLSDTERFGNLSVGTASALYKLNEAARVSGNVLDLAKLGNDVICTMLSDYTNGIGYIESMRSSLKEADITDDTLYDVLDSIEDEYSSKWLMSAHNLAESAAAIGGGKIMNTVTGGAFGFVTFAKDTVNGLSGAAKKGDAVKTFQTIYCINGPLDSAYDTVRNEIVNRDYSRITDYMHMFNLQKVVKKKAYESMRELFTRKDMKDYLGEELQKINNADYMIWK